MPFIPWSSYLNKIAEYWKSITISLVFEHLNLMYQIVLEKNLKFCKEYELIVFCHPEILQFLIAAISFVTDCKELKIAQTAQNIKLFQLLNLIAFTYTDIFYG